MSFPRGSVRGSLLITALLSCACAPRALGGGEDAGRVDARGPAAPDSDAGIEGPPDAAHIAGEDAGSAAPPVVRLRGAIGEWPVVLDHEAIGPEALVAVYFSDDGGVSWYMDHTRCAVAYGSSTLTPTFTLSAGRVVLERSYCTEGATDYQVVVEPADGSHVAAIGPRPFVWSHEELSLDALPVLSVLFSDDGGATWYADATRCAVRFGSRIQSHTIVLRDGTLELPENYCTAAATHVSIAWRAAESRTTIDLARVPASAGLELAASLLPIMSVSWSFDGGASRVFEHTRCAETYGSRSTTRTFELRDGTVTFPVNYCTEGATDAIVAR